MITFEFVEYEVKVRPTDMLVPEIAAVWNADRSPAKGEAQKDLKYIFLMADRTRANPNLSLPYYEAEPSARYMAYGSREFTIDKGRKARLDAAIQAYKATNESDDHRLFHTVRVTIENIRLYLDHNPLPAEQPAAERDEDDEEQDERPGRRRREKAKEQIDVAAMAKSQLKMIAEIDLACKTRDSIKSRITATEANQKHRAGVESSLLEDGLIGKHLHNRGAVDEPA